MSVRRCRVAAKAHSWRWTHFETSISIDAVGQMTPKTMARAKPAWILPPMTPIQSRDAESLRKVPPPACQRLEAQTGEDRDSALSTAP